MIKVFISSVRQEFANERQTLCEYIRRDSLLGIFFEPFIFEDVPANDLKPVDVFSDAVKKCEIYLGLLGEQYGKVGIDGISSTELEYNIAKLSQRACLVFLKRVDNREPKQMEFVKRVEQEKTRRTFQDVHELCTEVYSALVRYLMENGFVRREPFDIAHDTAAELNDLDFDKIKNFIHLAKAKRNFPLPVDSAPQEILRKLNLVDKENRLSNAAILLFGKEPQRFFITSEIKCAQFYGFEVEKPMLSYQIFKGDVFQLVNDACSFVMSHVDNWTGTRENGPTASVETRPELPFDAVKEAIVNAVCHRDYNSNASIQVMLFKDRLEIWNPGRLPMGLTVENLKKPHNSLPTNPLLAEPMYLSGYIEKLGTGTEDILKKCVSYGLKQPDFVQDSMFKVVIWRPVSQDGNQDGNQGGNQGGNQENLETTIVNLIRLNPKISQKQMADRIGKSPRTIARKLEQMKETVRFVGRGYSGHWEVLEK
jgi:predicted HTH transcriptional regulator